MARASTHAPLPFFCCHIFPEILFILPIPAHIPPPQKKIITTDSSLVGRQEGMGIKKSHNRFVIMTLV